MTPAQLSQAVREAFAYAARYVATIAANNPAATASFALGRPDIDTVLQQALDSAAEIADEAVREAWGSAPMGTYLEWLLIDVERQYQGLAALKADIRAAWNSVPKAVFVPGVTPPGTNPTTQAGHARALAIRDAILGYGSSAAMRSRLTAEVAATAAATARELAEGQERAEAGEQVYKQWRTSHQPPDAHTCHWCRNLNGVTVPLGASFPAGEAADLTGHGRLTQPPRLYHKRLPGPPRHPRCRCRIVIVSGPVSAVQGIAAAPQPVQGFLEASDVRDLPGDQYQALTSFLEGASHELGKALARLREAT